MQQLIIKHGAKISAFLIFVLTGLAVQAQDKIEIDTEEIGTWFERNWMWVAAGALLLFLLIILVSRSRNASRGDSRRTTTIIKDAQGNTKSVTTTEEKL
jgi:choline-glycine betaine transporter